MRKITQKIRRSIRETGLLLKSIPAATLTIFVVSVVVMNLLASKIILNESWIAMDAGIVCSWIAFLAMDMIVKRFGPKASAKVAIIAMLFNVGVAALFALAALVPGEWTLNDYATATSWWVIGASTTAFIVSAIADAFIHWMVLKAFKRRKESFKAHAASSYVSTMVGQFIDNLVFGLIFTFPFSATIGAPVTIGALIMFALVGAVVELLCQVIFSPLGFKIAERWRKQRIGQEYIDFMEGGNGNEAGKDKGISRVQLGMVLGSNSHISDMDDRANDIYRSASRKRDDITTD
jgi:uncharacterized PurR-regulated membrane protein YhhQ (DUF165 family)